MYFGWIPLEIPHYGLVDAQLWYEHLLFIYYTCGRIRYTTFVCSSPKPEMLEIACPFPFGAHMFAMDDNYSGPFTIAKFLTSQALMEARVFALPLSHSAIGLPSFPPPTAVARELQQLSSNLQLFLHLVHLLLIEGMGVGYFFLFQSG